MRPYFNPADRTQLRGGFQRPRCHLSGGHSLVILESKSQVSGRLGGSVGWVSDFGSGHDLTVREFEPRVRLCADSSEPGTCFGFCLSLSLPLSLLLPCSHAVSLSKINKDLKKIVLMG